MLLRIQNYVQDSTKSNEALKEFFSDFKTQLSTSEQASSSSTRRTRGYDEDKLKSFKKIIGNYNLPNIAEEVSSLKLACKAGGKILKSLIQGESPSFTDNDDKKAIEQYLLKDQEDENGWQIIQTVHEIGKNSKRYDKIKEEREKDLTNPSYEVSNELSTEDKKLFESVRNLYSVVQNLDLYKQTKDNLEELISEGCFKDESHLTKLDIKTQILVKLFSDSNYSLIDNILVGDQELKTDNLDSQLLEDINEIFS